MSMIESNRYFIEKIGKVVYSYVLPCTILILLLGVSPFIDRPRFFRSEAIDLGFRIFFCLWFIFGYRKLPTISKYRPTSVSTWSKNELDFVEKVFYIGLGVFYGIMVAILTRWIIQFFLPPLINLSSILAIFNGVIYSIPIITNYNVFKP